MSLAVAVFFELVALVTPLASKNIYFNAFEFSTKVMGYTRSCWGWERDKKRETPILVFIFKIYTFSEEFRSEYFFKEIAVIFFSNIFLFFSHF
jgi:hypothetical protein